MYVPSVLVSGSSHALAAREVLVSNIADIVGPMFIGNILNWMLFGTLIMQLYTYYQNFPSDPRGLRFLVYLVFFMDAVQTVLLTHHGWWFTITIWGVPDRFEEIPWSGPTIPFMAGLVSATVQMFYAWRIWILSKNKLLHGASVVIVLAALTQGISAMVAAMICASDPIQETLIRMHPEFSTWLAGSLANDIVITGCMLYILTQAKSQTTWGPSETLLTKLINRMISSGSATVVVAAVDLALFVKYPANNYHYVPAYILGKIYSNAFFLNLNLRRPQRGQYSESNMINTQPTNDSYQLQGAIRVQQSSMTAVSTTSVKFAQREQQETIDVKEF
ncbi:hypothetical protein R3P38DRAFT_3236178 [Favolaschia claudopus]|uniref:DUF6534 domain-containing protein n=1 Tax=Favolaschia claudopus TaxID=2862362 RepID=A0AAV9ZDB1_9AGAR